MKWEELIANVSIGSILELKAKEKDYKSKCVLLDFYGFEAVLPINEISNNYDLNFSLFKIIKKFEKLALVLIEIDNQNRKFIFSAKIFRNALDEILSFTKCKEIVENNLKTHLNIDSKFLISHRNTLDRIRGDLSSNELTFLYELIQNAVDHPNRNFNNNVSVTFEVFGNHLLVKHNGALFTENNFESITGILYGEQIQEGDKNRIGYKGIGFKSVFQYTNNVYIRSGNFSFRFSENESGSLKPWEVLPLFQYENEMVDKINQFDFFNSPVAFAIEFINEQSKKHVIKYLNQLSKNPYLLIFLENLIQLKIKAPSISYFEDGVSQSFLELNADFEKNITQSENFDSINLFKNSKFHSEWLIHTKNDIITKSEVIKELLDETVTAIPAKMRSFRTPRITIATQNKSFSEDTINLFTYLPLSNSKFKFPFLVNADFIPDLDRTDLIHNLKYNNEILNLVAITIKDFSQKLAQNNKLDYLNALIPDLSFDYQNSAKIIVDKLLEVLPETEVTHNGKKIPFSNIIIDKSGFVTSFGENLFQQLIDKVNVPIINLISYEKIVKFIEKILPDNIFDFTKLKEIVKSDEFKIWLKVPTNNLNFITYLNKNKYLNDFKDESIFLAEDGELYKGNELFINLGEDEDLLSWLGFKKILNKTFSSELSDVDLPLKQYDPLLFIINIICKEYKNEIINRISLGVVSSIDFYSYLTKYVNHSEFPINEIKQFPIKTKYCLLPNWENQIYFYSATLDALLSNKSVPANTFFLLDEKWSSVSSLYYRQFAAKIGVRLFLESEPYSFARDILVTKRDEIFNFYNSLSENEMFSNAVLWSFINSSFNNFSEPQKNELKHIFKSFPVLSDKNKFKELHTLYLPFVFTDDDSLEKISKQFTTSTIDFVNSDYLQISFIIKKELKSLFSILDAKLDTKDFLLHTILPNLGGIKEELFIPITKLIFDNKNSDQVINKVLNDRNFKIKTKEGAFIALNECYLGFPYIEETENSNPLEFINIQNQVSSEYTDDNQKKWRVFFSENLKIKSLINDLEIITLKLRLISLKVNELQIEKNSIVLFSQLYSLFKEGKLSLTDKNLFYIKNFPLLCKGDLTNFIRPNLIHFSSCFKPTFDFESIFGLDSGVNYLSDLYKFDDDENLILFFEKIGVTQYFDKYRHSSLIQNIQSLDGSKKPSNQLFKFEFKKIVGDSNVAFQDLSIFSYNDKTLEDYLGFKSKLSGSIILEYIENNEPEKKELKNLIIQFFKNYYAPNDLDALKTFISKGKLLSTSKVYKSVKELNWIDDSIKSGIRINDYLIDPLFNKQERERDLYLKFFNIHKIGITDFNPIFENKNPDNEFTKRVLERLVFLAFESENEDYHEIEKVYKSKFQEWEINKCNKITLKYPEIESKIIKEDNKSFEITNEKIFYYVGSWSDPRVNPVLVDCLTKNILGLNLQREFIQDVLLNNPGDIIKDIESKGRIVPEEIKQRFRSPLPVSLEMNALGVSSAESVMSNNNDVINVDVSFDNPFKDISNADVFFIRSIIKGDYELNQKLDANTTAKIKTLIAIKDKYDASKIIDEGRHLKAADDEYIVRSAQNGILYLDVFHWERLREANVKLAVYTKNQIKIFNSCEELINFTKPQNNLGIIRMPNGYSIEDYNSLGNISDKGKWHYVFIVNENTKIAKSYKEVMNLDDYNF